MGFIELNWVFPPVFPLKIILLVFVASLFSATTGVYLREEIYSIILTASLNLEIIFGTSSPCLLHIFSLSFAYVCIWRIMLIYVQKFAVDIRPVKVIKIPINPAVSGLAGGAEL